MNFWCNHQTKLLSSLSKKIYLKGKVHFKCPVNFSRFSFALHATLTTYTFHPAWEENLIRTSHQSKCPTVDMTKEP